MTNKISWTCSNSKKGGANNGSKIHQHHNPIVIDQKSDHILNKLVILFHFPKGLPYALECERGNLFPIRKMGWGRMFPHVEERWNGAKQEEERGNQERIWDEAIAYQLKRYEHHN